MMPRHSAACWQASVVSHLALASASTGSPAGYSTAPAEALTPSERERLKAELARLQAQYDTRTRRIAALDTDIGQTLGSLEKQVLEERRGGVDAERQKVADQMQRIEALLDAHESLTDPMRN